MEEKRCEIERKDERAFVALSKSPVTFIDVPLASSIGSARSACQLNPPAIFPMWLSVYMDLLCSTNCLSLSLTPGKAVRFNNHGFACTRAVWSFRKEEVVGCVSTRASICCRSENWSGSHCCMGRADIMS